MTEIRRPTQDWHHGITRIYKPAAETSSWDKIDVTSQVIALADKVWGKHNLSPYMQFLVSSRYRVDAPYIAVHDRILQNLQRPETLRGGFLDLQGGEFIVEDPLLTGEWFAGRDNPKGSPFRIEIESSTQGNSKTTRESLFLREATHHNSQRGFFVVHQERWGIPTELSFKDKEPETVIDCQEGAMGLVKDSAGRITKFSHISFNGNHPDQAIKEWVRKSSVKRNHGVITPIGTRLTADEKSWVEHEWLRNSDGQLLWGSLLAPGLLVSASDQTDAAASMKLYFPKKI